MVAARRRQWPPETSHEPRPSSGQVLHAYRVVERRRQVYLAIAGSTTATESEKRAAKDEYMLALEAGLEVISKC